MTKEQRDELLYIIQKEFPLTKRPFLDIAKKLNLTEEEIINQLKKEKEDGIIRQISPIYDTKKLGYKSSLVAFKIDPNDLKDATFILNSHPGISHNYQRNHSFNVWFTIAISKDSILGLENTIKILAKLTKAKEYLILPTKKMFKIQVKLNTSNKAPKKEKIEKKEYKNIEFTKFHEDFVKNTQFDIEITKEPFEKIIKKLNISYEEFFKTFKELKEAGILRRFAAILNHKKAGFSTNAMVVWDIDENKADDIGKKAASFSAVSHCYLRPKYPNWPYNLFTMIHAKSQEEIINTINEIANEIEYKDKKELYSIKEFKKQRIIYFSDEFRKWEEKYKDII